MIIIDGEEALTLKEAAKYLRMTYKDFFECFVRGKVQRCWVNGRQYLKKSDIERLRNQR